MNQNRVEERYVLLFIQYTFFFFFFLIYKDM